MWPAWQGLQFLLVEAASNQIIITEVTKSEAPTTSGRPGWEGLRVIGEGPRFVGWMSQMETEKTRRAGNAECGKRKPSKGCLPVAERPSGGWVGGREGRKSTEHPSTKGRCNHRAMGKTRAPLALEGKMGQVQMGRKALPSLQEDRLNGRSWALGPTLCSGLSLPPVPSMGGGSLVARAGGETQHCLAFGVGGAAFSWDQGNWESLCPHFSKAEEQESSSFKPTLLGGREDPIETSMASSGVA